MAGGITAAALDEHRFDPGVRSRLLDGGQVGHPILQRHLAEFDAVIGKRPPHPAALAGDGLQCVVDVARGRKHHIAGRDAGVHGGGDGMGAVDELAAHQCGFCTEHLGVDLLQLIPAQVVVAIAGGTTKAGVAHPVVPERLQHFGGVLKGHLLDGGKPVPALLFCPPGQLQQFFGKCKRAHIFLLAAQASRAAACSASWIQMVSAVEWMERPGMLMHPAGAPVRLTSMERVSVPPCSSTSS